MDTPVTDRHYSKEWSNVLGRDMEMLVFGQKGLPLLVFPTSMGRFYQWEDFGMVEALQDKIDAGFIHLVCVDSVDEESWYASAKHPHDRVQRHFEYERYLVEEVIRRLSSRPVAVGTSFGAFHALLLALRRPTAVRGFVGMSGAYAARRWLDGYFDDDVYFVDPFSFLPNLSDNGYLAPIRGMEKKVIGTGDGDPNVEDSRRVAGLLNDKDLGVWLDVWEGWAHDWPYWKEMIRKYV
jgi:esterase/lipase superfamily enzyme